LRFPEIRSCKDELNQTDESLGVSG
jgi:hypothetical protein